MQSVAAGQFVDVLGIRTHYITAGKGGLPLVLIHGGSPGASAGLSWKNNIDALAEAGIEVYAFDQPGYGHTDIPSDHSSAFRLAHAKAFIEAMDLGEYCVMGNSAARGNRFPYSSTRIGGTAYSSTSPSFSVSRTGTPRRR